MTNQNLDSSGRTQNTRPSKDSVTISTLSDSGTLSLDQYRELCKVACGPLGFGRGRVVDVAQFLVGVGFGNRLERFTHALDLYFSEAVSIRSGYSAPYTHQKAGTVERCENPPYVEIEDRKAEIDQSINETLRQITDELSPVWQQANRHAPLAPELAVEVKAACTKSGLRTLALTAVIGLGILGVKEALSYRTAQSSATAINLKSATLPALPK